MFFDKEKFCWQNHLLLLRIKIHNNFLSVIPPIQRHISFTEEYSEIKKEEAKNIEKEKEQEKKDYQEQGKTLIESYLQITKYESLIFNSTNT